MKRSFLLMCVVFVTLALAAQEAPKAEVFGGYSYLRADLSGISHENFNGWEASLTGNFNRYFGVTADFSGHYKSITGISVNDYSILFGPQLSYRTERVTGFGHALFGLNRAGATIGGSTIPIIGGFIPSASDSDTSYGMAFGGGFDVNVGKWFAIRLAQLDYLRTHHLDIAQNNLRYSAGIVLKLGSK